MLKKGDRVLIGLSGGPDSVCLADLLASLRVELGIVLHAVYVNHNLRPEEVEKEIAFCREYCRAKEIPFLLKSIELRAGQDARGNRQERARELRYAAFDEAAAEADANRIALGHHADDQLETFLLRLVRGAGPKGLAGIPPVRGMFIRPLIEIPKQAIAAHLEARGISFMIDSSNSSGTYLRNRVRDTIVPALKQLNPGLTGTMVSTFEILREEERYFEIAVTKALMKLISRKNEDRIELFLRPLEAMETVLIRRVLRRALEETRGLRAIAFHHIEEIIALIKRGSSGDRISLPQGIRVIRDYAVLVMTAEPPRKLGSYAFVPPGECVLREAAAVLRAAWSEAGQPVDGKNAVLLDADRIGLPLAVRARKPGDAFYPSGFGKRKKLQDYFVDEKVPRDERDAVPIVLSDDQIVWIAGYRPDDRFCASAGTRKFLKLEIMKANFS